MSIVLFYSELKEMLQKYFEGEKGEKERERTQTSDRERKEGIFVDAGDEGNS